MKIKEAKQIWKDSLYDDNFINWGLKHSDEVWDQIIELAVKNTEYFNEWISKVPELSTYMKPESPEYLDSGYNPALIFIDMLINDHIRNENQEKHKQFIKGLCIMAIELMPEYLQQPYLARGLMNQIEIYKINQ